MDYKIKRSLVKQMIRVGYEESGSMEEEEKKAKTSKTDRRISRLAMQNCRAKSHAINKILSDTGVVMSDRTDRRRLVAAGLRARIPRKKHF